MITADQALQIVLENVAPLGVERTPILDALGRVLAEEIRSPRDIPGFDNSAMDGYAVRAADIIDASETNPVRLAVVETVGVRDGQVSLAGPCNIHDSRSCFSHDLVIGHIVQDEEP